MGFLKNLLVEEVPEDTEDYSVDTTDYSVDEEAVNVESVNVDTLIEDIYIQNGLSEKTKSIFKVEELINSLPKEMVTETKKATVVAILGSFGLTVDGVCTDGIERIEKLRSVASQIVAENEAAIAEKQNESEELKRRIAALDEEINDLRNETVMANQGIINEVDKITELIKFVDNGGVQ